MRDVSVLRSRFAPLALALEFGAAPEFVTSAIFVSTLASIVTLTLLLTFVH